MMGGGYGGMMGGSGWLGLLVGILVFGGLLLAIAALVVYLIKRKPSSNGIPGATIQTAEDLLAARYARGELSREEFLRMREDLGQG